MRRRVLGSVREGAVIPTYLELTLEGSSGGGWGIGKMTYSCEVGSTVYDNMWETGSRLRIPIPYKSTYIAPTRKDTYLYLYTGDHLNVRILNKDGDFLELRNRVTWEARPGGYSFEYPIFSWYTWVSLLGNDPIPVSSDHDKLLCNPGLFWDGEFIASFYIYV